jgi:hypothetical protein
VERWADLGDGPPPDETGPFLFLPAELDATPERHPAGVYHPPR